VNRRAASALRVPAIAFAFAFAFASRATRAQAAPDVAACADAAEQGQELRAAQKLVVARQRFLACAQRECPAAVRDSCTEWLGELERRIPSLVVDVKDEKQHDVRDVTVTLDGERLPASVTSRAVHVDPGPHVLRCESRGYESVAEELVLREGEPLRVVNVTLKSSAPVALTHDEPRRLPVGPLVLGATSLVALGVFAVVGATAASDYRTLERECAPRCPSERIDGIETRFFVADVALVAGIVTGATAVAWWLIGASHTPAARH